MTPTDPRPAEALTLRPPRWLVEGAPVDRTVPSPEERMELVIGWARRNVERETGGPFAAGVFEIDTGRLVAPGVNRVVPERCSAAHAEVVALSLAQQRLGTHDLSTVGAMELLASADPCAMCLGAVHWSGISRLVCAAGTADVQATGFDEGPQPPDWPELLEERGVTVRRGLLRDRAREVLELYRENGGPIYNAGR